MMKLFVLFLFVAAVSAASISNVPFIEETRDCGSTADILAMRVTGCVRNPCEFPAGETVVTEVDFSPKTAHPHLISHIQIIFGGIPVDIHYAEIPNSEVEPGKGYTVTNTIPIEKSLEGATLSVQIAVYGHTGNSVIQICKQADAKIVA